MPEIKVLCLDLGGVVVQVHPERLVKAVAEAFGKNAFELADYFQNSGVIEAYETGRLNAQSFHARLQADWQVKWSFADFKAVWNSMIEPDAGTQVLLERLKGAIPMIALSNISDLHLDYIRDQLRLFESFQHVVASCEVGYRKPQPEIFKLAILEAQANPEHILYFDDRAEFVSVARTLGIQAVQCPSPTQLPDLVRMHLELG